MEAAEALADLLARPASAGSSGSRRSRASATRPATPSWPELSDQTQVWKLLEPDRTIGVTLTEAHQMVPEQSTSAVVLHHPQAIYFTVRGLQRA